MKLLPPKTGWKTYAVVAIGIGLGIAQQQGVHVPGWVDWLLSFLGLGALRHAVTSQSAKSAAALEALGQTVFQAITVPDPNAGLTGASVKTIPVETRPLPPIEGKSS
jgi:hypothetical protein